MAVRADAQRNREALLTHAIGALSAHPEASMQDVAAASGLTRTTVYRHFPSRDSLVAALYERIDGEARVLVADAVAHGDAPAVLEHLAAGVIALAERYRFLAANPRPDASSGAGDAELLAWLRAARRRGELRTDTPAAWQQAMLRGMVTAACEEVVADRAAPARAIALLTASLHRTLIRTS